MFERVASSMAALIWFSLVTGCARAETTTWHSDAIGRDLQMRLAMPGTVSTRPASVPAVIVLQNLRSQTPDGAAKLKAVDLLCNSGNAVLTIDYANDDRATIDVMGLDLLKLRSDIKDKKLLLDPSIDVNRLWILPEGVALKRDVAYFKTDQRTWQLDIAYPVASGKSVPTLMEITCDNASRMGNFSLVFCHDTLLEGALLRGFAAAMIDHPVPAPYKGLDDPMPDLIHRLKSAVRTMRAQSNELKLNGKIGTIGFSRGGPMAAFLAVTNGRTEFEVGGEHAGVSSDVEAALIHGNRYDYSNLRADDPMLARFEKAWGKLDEHRDAWLAHGAAHYLRESAAPMFLNTSDAESAEYRDGLAHFEQLLADRSIEHRYRVDADGRGHRVTTDPARLDEIYTFFGLCLSN